MLALLPTLYSHISSLFAPIDASEYKIRNQEMYEDFISMLIAIFD